MSIRLKVFISSAQKELCDERIAVSALLATDPFLSSCTVPRLFEEYPSPLQPNPKPYLDLLQTCQVYLLIMGKEYGIIRDQKMNLSATHEEYNLAKKMQLPTLVCVKGDRNFNREKLEDEFFNEIRKDDHTYSRFKNIEELQDIVRKRLIEHIKTTFDTKPTQEQNALAQKNIKAASPFERTRIIDHGIDILDWKVASEIAAAAEEKPLDTLKQEDVIRSLSSRGYLWFDHMEICYRPTAAAVLLMAKTPSFVFTQARIQLDAYAGQIKDANPIDSIFLDEPLPRAIEHAVAFIRRNTSHPLRVKNLKREKTEAYPQEALREAIVNAVAHRDYSDEGIKPTIEVFSDRVVITNPGLPPGGQSIIRISKGEGGPRSRNPLIVQSLNWLEFMDERGSGIRRMRDALIKHGSEFPLFRLQDQEFSVSLFAHTRSILKGSVHDLQKDIKGKGFAELKDITERQRQILKEIQKRNYITTALCVQSLGIARDTAWRDLKDLQSKGFVKQTGTGRATRYIIDETNIGRKSGVSRA